MCTVSRIGKTRGNTSDPKASTKQQTAVGGGMQQCIEIIRERYLPNTGSSFCLSSLSLSLFLSLFQSLSLFSYLILYFSMSPPSSLSVSLRPSILCPLAVPLSLRLCRSETISTCLSLSLSDSVYLYMFVFLSLSFLCLSVWSLHLCLSGS